MRLSPRSARRRGSPLMLIVIELLEYIAPADGRAAPTNLNRQTPAFRETCISIRHPRPVQPAEDVQQVRDPDGHVVRLQRQ